MARRFLLSIAILLLVSTVLPAQSVLKTVTISSDILNTPSTPRVVRNGFQHVWLIAWRQQGTPPKILGRVMNSDGSLKARKILVNGVGAAEQSFDLFYDSIHYTYLLAYETSQGLSVQPFNGNLAKTAPSILIEAGVGGTIPRLSYDSVADRFSLFWLSTTDGISRKVLKSLLLDHSGRPVGTARVLATAPGSSTYGSLNISTNQKTGNSLAMTLEGNANAGRLVGFNVKPDASLLRPKILLFQPATPGLSTIPDASFSDNGSGFAVWTDRNTTKMRKINAVGNFVSPGKSIAAADLNSRQTSILFDSRNNQFISVWAQSNRVTAVVLNSTTGSLVRQPFDIGISSLTGAQHAVTSYDAQQGNALAVWEDFAVDGAGNANRFRVRAALFFFQGAATQQGITIGDNFFSSRNGNGDLTISAGNTVTWTNNGNNLHTVTSGTPSSAGGMFDSGNLNRGDSFSYRFTQEGRFPYFCRLHGSAVMSGTITVQAEGEPPPRY